MNLTKFFRKERKLVTNILLVAIVFSFGVFSLGKAQGENEVRVKLVIEPVIEQVAQSLGLADVPDTGFGDVTLQGDLTVLETSTLTGTTTLGIIGLPAQSSKSLTLTAAATTTPGGTLALQNTGSPLVCKGVPEVVFTSQIEGSMDFSFGTSTSATAWSASGGSLIATTTVATGTSPILGARIGSYWTVGDKGIASTTVSWIWNNGDYILGAFDKGQNTRNNASTTDYTTAAAKIYLDCHAR